MALYPYTLQPIDLNLTEAEFRQAQTQLFESNNQNLVKISTKTWIILAITVILAIAGLFLVKGYSTIIFWLMLVGVIVYLIARTYGLKWYVKQEFQKQLANQTLPDEIKDMKLGIQQHGIIMSIPVQNVPHMPRGFNQPMMRGQAVQQAVIKWENVTNWQETADFIFMMFEVKGQQGSQIVPKRLSSQKFPIDTLRNHLQEHIGKQGFDLSNKPTDKYFPNHQS